MSRNREVRALGNSNIKSEIPDPVLGSDNTFLENENSEIACQFCHQICETNLEISTHMTEFHKEQAEQMMKCSLCSKYLYSKSTLIR